MINARAPLPTTARHRLQAAVRPRPTRSSRRPHRQAANHAQTAAYSSTTAPAASRAAAHAQLEQQHSPAIVAARVLQVLRALVKLSRLQQPVHIQQTVSDLGPLWVKLGQTLAVRPDVVGPRLAAALSGLQESAPPFPTATAAHIIQQELGAPPAQLFAWWSGPVAAASLGQVYQAALKADGSVVAVKVQRPNLWSQISLDLSILAQLLRLLRWAGRIQQDITRWADTLGTGLACELDYVQEARNLSEFGEAHRYLSCVATPAVVWELTSTRVLTTTWVEGQTPGQILRCMRSNSNSSSSDTVSTTGAAVAGADTHGSSGHEQQQQQMQGQLLRLVDLGIQASLHQLVVTGVLHADPHPGNLLLSGDRLVFLDFGLLVKVPPEASMAIMAALLHWSQANWLALAGDMRQMGLLKPRTDLQQLAADLEARFTQLYAQQQPTPSTTTTTTTSSSSSSSSATSINASGRCGSASSNSSSVQPSALLQRAGDIGFAEFAGVIAALALKYRFELPPFYTLVIRSLTTLEGFALLVDPSARASIARTAVKVVARQLLFDQRPAARKLLQEVLVLQDAPQQPQGKPGRLNLQLLEELLLLAAPDAGPPNVNAPASQLPALSTAEAAAALVPGSDAGARCRSPRQANDLQSVDLLQLTQEQLGLSVSEVAAQLSSPEAAGVRALLAQQLVHRWLHTARASSSKGGRQQKQKARLKAGSSPGGVQPPPTPEAAVTTATAGTTVDTQHAGGRHDAAAVHHKVTARETNWWGLLVQAGVSGVRFAGQLLWLAVALLAMRALAWVQRLNVFGVGRFP